MALSSSWDGSNVHEDHIAFLHQTRRLPGEDFVRVRLAPEKEISLAPEEGEQLHHLTPNAVMLLSAFVMLPDGPKALQVCEVEDLPAAGEGEVLVGVAAIGVNHDDTVQRRGRYPSPAGASPYPELECSDTNVTLRANDSPHWAVSTKVCAPLTGGGYAVKVVVSAGQVLPVMEGVSLTDAASLPKVACTVWSTVFITNHHSPGESFLMHGGSSGISTFAVQIAKHLGVKFFVTVGM
ncbi:quinone oxidoreductase PIG3-like [Triticum dicoccoides]|uniref:quinone oxidoreductase PIG3-like n=1 Tax=Triticum dicoccoides TaxID=85692 RepID=UPI00188EE7AC|nr:quinone oxidoreductase PIG3-like [Triticum dicoccoides]